MTSITATIAKNLRNWFDAIRNYRDNPLIKYWTLSDKRRSQKSRFGSMGLGLLILGVLLSALSCVGLIYLIVRSFNVLPEEITKAHMITTAVTAVSVVLCPLIVFSFCWMIARLFTFAQTCLSFLESGMSRTARIRLDDMLASSAVTEQEILVAVAHYGLRMLMPPLALLTVSSVIQAPTIMRLFHWPLLNNGIYYWATPQNLVLGILLIGILLLSAALTILISCYLLLPLSNLESTALTSFIGAVGYTIVQFAVIVWSIALTVTTIGINLGESSLYADSLFSGMQFSVPPNICTWILVLLIVLVSFTRPSNRKATAHLILLWFAAIGYFSYFITDYSYIFRKIFTLNEFEIQVQTLSSFQSILLFKVPNIYYVLSHSDLAMQYIFGSTGWSLLLQIVLLFVFVNLSKLAVVRRKQGTSETTGRTI